MAAEDGSTRGVRPTLRAFARPPCRCASIILFADDAWLLTVLRNVVAYVCRPSLREDRHHGLACTPPPGDQSFGRQRFAAGRDSEIGCANCANCANPRRGRSAICGTTVSTPGAGKTPIAAATATTTTWA